MSPEFRSASIAICLPGMASRVNRAPTSATRPAPLVMTTNWMTSRIENTIRPTISDPPTTKWPKVSITFPANPSRSTRRVALTFSARRNRVITRITAGKAAKSRGPLTNIAVMRTRRATVMLSAMSRSRSIAGRGTTSITTIITMPIGTASWLSRFRGTSSSRGRRGDEAGAVPGTAVRLRPGVGFPIGRRAPGLRGSGDLVGGGPPRARRAGPPRSAACGARRPDDRGHGG